MERSRLEVTLMPGVVSVSNPCIGPFQQKITGSRLESLTEQGHNGRQLLVHHWDISRTPPPLLECNCSAVYGTRGHSHSRSNLSSQVAASTFNMKAPFLPAVTPYVLPTTAPTVPVYTGAIPAYATGPMAPGLATPVAYQYVPVAPVTYYAMPVAAPMMQQASGPVYSTALNGTPVNVSKGAVRTESRGVFIGNLSYSAESLGVEQLLRQVGINPTRVEINRDSSGRSKGSAIASFSTKEEAQRVVSRLNNVQYMGMILRVKLDAERTAISGAAAPVIVDGSNYQVCACCCSRVQTLTVSLAEETLNGQQHQQVPGSRAGRSQRNKSSVGQFVTPMSQQFFVVRQQKIHMESLLKSSQCEVHVALEPSKHEPSSDGVEMALALD